MYVRGVFQRPHILQQATLFICLNYRVFGATIRLSGSSDGHKFYVEPYLPLYRCYQNCLILVASVQ